MANTAIIPGSPTPDQKRQDSLNGFADAYNAFLARQAQPAVAASVPVNPNAPGPVQLVAPLEAQAAPEQGGLLSNLGTAMNEADVSGSAQFLSSPLGQWVGKFFDPNLPTSAQYQAVRNEAGQASEAAAQAAGPDWSGKRILARGAQMVGGMLTPQGLAGVGAAAVTGGAAAPLLEGAGLGTYGAIAAREGLAGLTQGVTTEALGSQFRNDHGGVQSPGEIAKGIGYDLASAAIPFGLHGLGAAFAHAGEAGYSTWVSHMSEGETPFAVSRIDRPVTAPDGSVSTVPAYAFGRGQFDPINHPQAWQEVTQGAGLSRNEVVQVERGAAGPATLEKLNSFLTSAQGKTLVNGLDAGYTQELWMGAKAALQQAGMVHPDPHAIAQLADAMHTGRAGTAGLGDITQAPLAGPDGQITAQSIAAARQGLGNAQAVDAAALAKRFTQTLPQRLNPLTKLSSTAEKGITPADADAAMGAAQLASIKGPELDPRSPLQQDVRMMDARIDSLLQSDPDAAGQLAAQRKAAVLQENARLAQGVPLAEHLDATTTAAPDQEALRAQQTSAPDLGTATVAGNAEQNAAAAQSQAAWRDAQARAQTPITQDTLDNAAVPFNAEYSMADAAEAQRAAAEAAAHNAAVEQARNAVAPAASPEVAKFHADRLKAIEAENEARLAAVKEAHNARVSASMERLDKAERDIQARVKEENAAKSEAYKAAEAGKNARSAEYSRLANEAEAARKAAEAELEAAREERGQAHAAGLLALQKERLLAAKARSEARIDAAASLPGAERAKAEAAARAEFDQIAHAQGTPAPEPVGPGLPSDAEVAALVPDLPPDLVSGLLKQALSPGAKPDPALTDALQAHFTAEGGADKLGPWAKWKGAQTKRVMAALEAAGQQEPRAAMARSEGRIAQQATAPETRAEQITHADENVTFMGSVRPWGELRESGEAKFLTSPEFIASVERHIGKQLPGLTKAAESALTDARTFRSYVELIEGKMGDGFSLTLPPEQYALTRDIAQSLEAIKAQLAEQNLAPLPYSSEEALVRALSRYFAQEMHFDRASFEDLAGLQRALKTYMRMYSAGALKPEEHAAFLRGFGNLVDGVRVAEGLTDKSGNALLGDFDPVTNQVSLNTGAMLDTAVHEILHAWFSTDPDGIALMRELADSLDAKTRVQLNDLLGGAGQDASYAMSTEESVVRAMQAVLTDPDALVKAAPKLAKVLERGIEKLNPDTQGLFDFFSSVQQAMGSIHAKGDYRYDWLSERYAEGKAPYDYARSFSITTPKGWAKVFKEEVASYSDKWLRDSSNAIPVQRAAYAFVQDVMDARNLAGAEHESLARRGMPDPLLASEGEAASASADGALRRQIAEELGKGGRTWARARQWLSRWQRLLPVEARASKMILDPESKIAVHAEPHIAIAHELANMMYRGLNAAENRMVSGKNGLLQQDWLRDFTRTARGNAKEALRSFLTGEARLANPEDNAALSAMAKEAWDRRAWHTDTEIDADARLSASAKAAYKFITHQTMERSAALKQNFVEDFLAREESLAHLRGKGMTTSDLRTEGGLTEGQLRDLDVIDAGFREGYFPTTRMGDFRVYGKDANGKLIYATGAATAKEADAKVAALLKRDGIASAERKRVPELPPMANQLDAAGSTIAQMLHYLRDTEHGAELTTEDFETVLRKMQEPGALKAYFAHRAGIPGWEDEDFVARHAEFLRKSALFEHGQVFKRGINALMTQDLSDAARQDVTNLFNNAMNNRSKLENALIEGFQQLAPDARHFRYYSQLLRKLAYAKVLGFSNFKRVALDVNHGLSISLNELSAEAGALERAFGQKGGTAYALRQGVAATKDAARWLSGDTEGDAVFEAFQKAVDAGYMRTSPVLGGSLKDFLARRAVGTPGQAGLNAALEHADFLGHASTAVREMATFSAFYRTYSELAPGMSEEARIAFAGDKTMNTLNLRASNRPTLAGMQGEVANEMLSFKAFLGNVLSKVMQNARLAKGTFVEIPNPDWEPGSALPRTIALAHKDAGNMLKMVAMMTALGGPIGIPLVGWAVNQHAAWTGTDPTLEWKAWAHNTLGGESGRFLGALLDKGLVNEFTGYDMSEVGNLMLPNTKDGLLATFMPAAISIAGQTIKDAYHGITKPQPMTDPTIQVIKALSPNAFKHLTDAAQLLANHGRIYTAQGQLIGHATPADAVKVFFAGMAPLRDDDYRKAQVDANVQAQRNLQLHNLADGIVRKIVNNEELDTSELGALWSTPGVHERVQKGLRAAEIPTYKALWERIERDKDPESARLRAGYYQAYWQDAIDAGAGR